MAALGWLMNKDFAAGPASRSILDIVVAQVQVASRRPEAVQATDQRARAVEHRRQAPRAVSPSQR
jgi:hypothetical protein